MPFVIRDTHSGSYYEGTTAIGPIFNPSQDLAMVFPTKEKAYNVMYSHSIAFVLAEVVEVPNSKDAEG